jgi:ABC-type sugar transport system substrate-binding protein
VNEQRPHEIGRGGASRREFVVRGAAASGAAGITAFLAACGGGSPAAPGKAGAAGGSPAAGLGAKKDQTYYWVTANLGDPFYQDGIAGMKKFGDLFGVKVQIVGPQKNDVAGMTQALQETLAKPDVAGIFSYYYADFNAAKSLYEEAAKKQIPVVNGAGDWGPPRLSFVGVRDQDAPSAAVDLIGDALGGKGKVGYIGNTGTNIVREEKFFEQFLKERFSGIQFVGNAAHDGSADDALKQYRAFVQRNRDVNAMFFGDGLGPSIADALVQANPNVKLVLRGFGQNGLKAIQAGKVLGTVDRNPYDEELWGFMPLYFAVNGNYRAPDSMIVPTITVTKDNVDGFIKDPYHNVGVDYSSRA